MPEPKYKIGQYVYIAQEVKGYDENGLNYESIGNSKPRPIMIVDILTETCYAGTQIHYGFRGFNTNGGSSIIRMSEIELTEIAPKAKEKR